MTGCCSSIDECKKKGECIHIGSQYKALIELSDNCYYRHHHLKADYISYISNQGTNKTTDWLFIRIATQIFASGEREDGRFFSLPVQGNQIQELITEFESKRISNRRMTEQEVEARLWENPTEKEVNAKVVSSQTTCLKPIECNQAQFAQTSLFDFI